MLRLLSSGGGGRGGGTILVMTPSSVAVFSRTRIHITSNLGAFSVYCILDWQTARSLHELGQYLASLQRSLANMLSKRLP